MCYIKLSTLCYYISEKLNIIEMKSIHRMNVLRMYNYPICAKFIVNILGK